MLSNIKPIARSLSSVRRFASVGQKYAGPRDPNFAVINDKDLTFFESIVGKQSGMITDGDDLALHNSDWTKKFIGQS
jgi:hypothetical protein